MALSADDKSSLLFKISLGFADTGPLPGGSTSKAYYAESIPSRPTVYPTQIWAETDSIPTTAPAMTNGQTLGVLQYFEDVAFTSLASSDTAFYLADLIDAVPFNFDPSGSYVYDIKKASGDPIAFGVGDWVLDTASGVINFYGSPPSGVNAANPPTISFYKYVGKKGGGSASVTISDVAPTDPAVGDMWWNSITGDLLIYYDDGVDGPQWVTAVSSAGGLWELNAAGTEISTPYTVAASAKAFKIPHPLESMSETHDLMHTSVESDKAELLYRGKATCVDGHAEINLDEVGKMTEGTFESLAANPSCFVSNETNWSQVRGKVEGNILKIQSMDNKIDLEVSWLVVATRKDPTVLKLSNVDENGEYFTEIVRETKERPKLDDIKIGNLTIKR